MSFDIQLSKGDLVLQGDFALVTGTRKLVQDMTKMVLTTKGTNAVHPEIGTTITNNVVGQVIGTADTLISGEVESSLDILMNLQDQQSRYQRVAPSELLAKLEGVTVARDPQEPRQINIGISVLTQALAPVEVNIPLNIVE